MLRTGRLHMSRLNAAGLAVGVAAVLAPSAMAQTRTWRNSTNGTFSVTGNWVGSIVPGPANPAVFGLNAGTTPFTVTFTGGVTNAGLTISNQRPIFNLAGFTYNISGDTNIGGTNAPALTINNGTLNTRAGGGLAYVGRNVGQTGSLSFGSGAISTGINFVGAAGSGTVAIDSGAVVTNRNGEALTIGEQVGSTGLVTVSGATSRLIVPADLFPGRNGNGTLRVENGAVVTTNRLAVANGNGTGLVVISGPGSRLESTGSDGRSGADGAGQGTIIVENGGAFTHGVFMHGGGGPGARGDFIVRGTGSTMTTQFLHLGDGGGTGTLRVENGGVVTCSGGIDLTRFSANSVASLTVDGAGSVFNAGNLATSNGGLGTIVIENGGRINLTGEMNAGWPGSRQTWTVRGSGSTAQFGSIFRVNDAQSVQIRVESGATWNSTDRLELANNAATSVNLLVTGTGSTMTLAGELASNSGAAAVEVSNGATLTALNGFRLGGGYTNAPRSLLVRGTDSRLIAGDSPNTGGSFYVGYESTNSTATIDQGAKLTINSDAFVGHRGTGVLTVSGLGTTLQSPYRLHVGLLDNPGSSGIFNLLDGAMAELGSLRMADSTGSGTTAANLLGGSLMTLSQGVEVFESAVMTVSDGSGLEGGGGMGIAGTATRPAEVVVRSAGYVFMNGNIDIGSNLPRTDVGILTLDGGTAFTLQTMPVFDNGILRGVGLVEGHVSASGIIRPGLPLGDLTVRSLDFNPNARLEIELGGTGAGQFDRVVVQNATNLNGTLAVSLANGFVPVAGQTFDVLTADTRNGTFTSIAGSDLGGGLALLPQYLPGGVRLVVDAVTAIDIPQTQVAVYEGFANSLAANAIYAVAPAQNVAASAIWSSDDPSIVIVDANGKVRGIAPGTTTIRATYAGFTDSVTVIVAPLPVPGGLQPGLDVEYRKLYWPDFATLTPVLTEARPQAAIPFNPNWGVYGTLTNQGDARLGGVMTATLLVPAAGDYTFQLQDGLGASRLLINGVPAVVEMNGVWFNTQSTGVVSLPAGPASIRFEYSKYGNYGGYGHALLWSGPGIPSLVEVPAAAFASPGVAMNYYSLPEAIVPQNPEQYVPANYPIFATGISADLNYPVSVFPNFTTTLSDNVGATFTGWLVVPQSATYTLRFRCDDGGRLYISGNLAARSQVDERVIQVALDRGLNAIRVEGYEIGGDQALTLEIEGPGIARQAVPATAFWRGTPVAACVGDLNNDSFVDDADFVLFADAYNLLDCADPTMPAGCPSDLNGDTFVDDADFVLFAEAYNALLCP
jgi:T5SS/PEP-CTERM-associated repeat protein